MSTRKAKQSPLVTNHLAVLVLLAKDREQPLRKVAATLDLTERAVQRIVTELEADGYLSRGKDGRKNTYTFDFGTKLDSPVGEERSASVLVNALV